MKVLVIGGGGREHALAWKLAQSPRVQLVYVAPGNGGTALDGRLVNVPITDNVALREWALKEKIALTVVGPEGPLAAGVVDEFRAHGLRVFGPTKEAAQLESSKAFSKAFMKRHGIPTAEYETFTDAVAAHAYVDRKGAPIVVKADGLAAGKGVVVAMSAAQAHEAIDFMLLDNKLGVVHNDGEDGKALPRVVIEEFLVGEEASFIVLCDGKNVTALATSQDHKRLLDNDEGPNTGGMGAYSPAPVVTPEVHARAMREIILPTIKGMEKDGIVFTGFLYAGLMIDPKGQVKTLEFNCRMGDPETQPIMMRLKSDLYDVMMHATSGTLDQVELQWDRRPALGVVIAAHGYPVNPRKGDAVTGLPGDTEDAVVFHAGTQARDGGTVTCGGRVLCVTALADTVKTAQLRAYEVAQCIAFDGMQMRRDIGHRAIRGQG
ncbi:MAG: phosphoribosylamine--glycine ligase [Ramlibacter sp.]